MILVSFYDRSTAKKWIQDVHTSFPMYIDSECSIYKLLGYRSRAKLKASTLAKAFKYMVTTWRAPTIPRSYIPTQTGGNLIITRGEKILYLYRSESSDDRPAVEDILLMKP